MSYEVCEWDDDCIRGKDHEGKCLHPSWMCECGYERDTFSCKIRHIQINTGDAKAARD